MEWKSLTKGVPPKKVSRGASYVTLTKCITLGGSTGKQFTSYLTKCACKKNVRKGKRSAAQLQIHLQRGGQGVGNHDSHTTEARQRKHTISQCIFFMSGKKGNKKTHESMTEIH